MKANNELKVVLLGDSGVGKSSVMLRFIINNFRLDTSSTIGASFMSKVMQLGERSIKFNIWDTAGQERYHSLARMYLRDADSAILIYDITNKESFKSLKTWHNELKEIVKAELVVAVCGNKEDLVEDEEVNPQEAVEFTSEVKGFFRKISAKSNLGIESVFKEIAYRFYKDIGSVKDVEDKIVIKRSNSRTDIKKNCC